MTESGAFSKNFEEDLAKWLGALRHVGAYAGGGLWRQPFTPADREAKDLIAGWMRDSGMSVRQDHAGNLFGRIEGREGGPAVLSGSHIDSVKAGGEFDGTLGVLAPLAALRELLRTHGAPRRPIEIVALCGEEQSRFRVPFIGSRGMLGQLGDKDLSVKDADGITLAEAMAAAGCDSARIGENHLDYAAFLELHIEQGPVLEAEGTSVGVVTDIVGITQKTYRLVGEANHGGTTPMLMRRDALRTAARVLAQIPEICMKASDTAVATVGMIEVLPGAVSNIPATVNFTLDARDPRADVRHRIVTEIDNAVAEACASDGLEWSQQTHTDIEPTPMDSSLCEILVEEARRGNISCRVMHSGAGHDAMILAAHIPTAMIFVPSKGGKSHTPEEHTDMADIMQGVYLLYRALFRLGFAP